MEMLPLNQLLLLGVLVAVSMITIGYVVYMSFVLPMKRKAFIVKEMAVSLNTREKIYGAELIGYCRNILQNVETHCNMRESFKLVYTYGEFEIGVNWYPLTGMCEFTLPSKHETIAKIYYPT